MAFKAFLVKISMAVLLLVFLEPVGFQCNTLTSKYYYKFVPLSSWSIQDTFPNVLSEFECSNICCQEHLGGNCCYHLRYDELEQTCEIGKIAEMVDAADVDVDLHRILSKTPPDMPSGWLNQCF